jgi:hypothetical protein
MTLKKVTNNIYSVPSDPFEDKWGLTHLDGLCGQLRSPFVTVLGVVEFISSIFFHWYRWCHYWSFDMSSKTFFLFFSLFFSLSYLISLYCKLCQPIFNFEESRRCHVQLSKLCYFLNIFFIVLLFLSAKVQKKL